MNQFEQARNSELFILQNAGIVPGTFTATADVVTAMIANRIPGVTDFGYDHENDVQRRGKGQFGQNKPVGITDAYNGIKGSLDTEGADGETAVLAAINGQAKDGFVLGHYNKLKPFFVIANVKDDNGNPLAGHICYECKADGVPKKISGDAKRVSFQGVEAMDFRGKTVRFAVIQGNATPVVSLAYPTGATPYGWKDEDSVTRYALLVLRFDGTAQASRRLAYGSAAAAGVFAETSSAITLNAADGLAVADKALIVWVE